MSPPGIDWPACIGVRCWPHRAASVAALYPGRAIPFCGSCADFHRLVRTAIKHPAEPVEFLDLEQHPGLAARIARAQKLPEALS